MHSKLSVKNFKRSKLNKNRDKKIKLNRLRKMKITQVANLMILRHQKQNNKYSKT